MSEANLKAGDFAGSLQAGLEAEFGASSTLLSVPFMVTLNFQVR